jgi:hypothetical protein
VGLGQIFPKILLQVRLSLELKLVLKAEVICVIVRVLILYPKVTERGEVDRARQSVKRFRERLFV